MPLRARRTHQPRKFLCNKRTSRTCGLGFSSLSGLTRHQNKMHPLPNNQLLPALPVLPPPEFSPPPDDMYFNDGENNPPPDDMYFDDAGENNPGPHEAIEGDVQTLRHPILNGMSFIHTFLFYIQDTLLLGMPCDSLGNYLPPDTPPPPFALPGEDDAAHNAWDPFHNRAQFEITDFLYR
jgi:hypothetical protein